MGERKKKVKAERELFKFWGFGFSITLLVHAMPRALKFTLREWFYDTASG